MESKEWRIIFNDHEIMCLKSHFTTLEDKFEITNCDFKEWIHGKKVKMLTYLDDNDILYVQTKYKNELIRKYESD